MKQTITILIPTSIIMKRFVPEGCALVVEEGDVILDLDHIVDRNMATNIKIQILVLDEKPIVQRPRRLSPLETDIVRKQVNEWLVEEIVHTSTSEYASSIVLPNKKNGTKKLCVEYRKIIAIICKDCFPMPLIDGQKDKLQDVEYFSMLDLRNRFFHVPVEESSIKYTDTAFLTPFGFYEFIRALFHIMQ